ncbi:hypothetical protein [Caldisericum exile]|jgi:hypothetical protein
MARTISPEKSSLIYVQKFKREGKELWGSHGILVSSYKLLFIRLLIKL